MTKLVEGPFDAERVRALREMLTATGAGIYLATHQAGPTPAESLAAARESDEMELRVGRVGPDRGEDLLQRDREARAVLAAAIHASPDRLVIAHGVADAIRLVALHALAAAGDSRPAGIMAVGDHSPLVLAALEGVAAACQVDFRHVAATRRAAVGRAAAGRAALVALSHVDRAGSVQDVGALAPSVRAAGGMILLDASLSCGAIPIEVSTLGADAVVADANRWLLGPEAATLTWLGPSFVESAPAAIRATIAPFPRGTLIALARSVGWLLMFAELPWLLERTRLLVERLLGSLRAIGRVTVLTEPVAHAALVAFRIEGWSAEQAGDELAGSTFAILEADAEHDLLRLGVGAWNREDELSRFVERVAELAAHTPDSLPRRPTLTVLTGPPEGGS